MKTNWETLIERYCPEGMRVCNCRQAYETLLPASKSGASRMVNGVWTDVEAWRCVHGCSSAQIAAKEIVATAILNRPMETNDARELTEADFARATFKIGGRIVSREEWAAAARAALGKS